jgi:hypothetical protein
MIIVRRPILKLCLGTAWISADGIVLRFMHLRTNWQACCLVRYSLVLHDVCNNMDFLPPQRRPLIATPRGDPARCVRFGLFLHHVTYSNVVFTFPLLPLLGAMSRYPSPLLRPCRSWGSCPQVALIGRGFLLGISPILAYSVSPLSKLAST